MSPLSASRLTAPEFDPAAFERLAQARLSQTPPCLNDAGSPGDDDLNPSIARSTAGLRPAAVLVPVVAVVPLSVILTERTGQLSSHAGQIAFPGGKMESHDADPIATALRETQEEIALASTFIKPLGFLPAYRTGTGYIITPVVALVSVGFKLEPDPAEVADIFEVPLSFLMDEANHHIEARTWRGVERKFYAMPYGERYIWGATAGIIRALYRSVFAS